jgi:hypothetical protein
MELFQCRSSQVATSRSRDSEALMVSTPRGRVLTHNVMRRSALAMLDLYRSGEPLHGLPTAISRRASDKILIEGYKRSMVAPWANRPQFKYISVCRLPPVCWILRSRKISVNN